VQRQIIPAVNFGFGGLSSPISMVERLTTPATIQIAELVVD
jgi:hypothetical protein